jgi:hypothetical protein
METIPNPQGPRDPSGEIEVPDGNVREPPLPSDGRNERFPGSDDLIDPSEGGGVEKHT